VLLSSLGAIIASLCCLTPLVLVFLGFASISTAVSLDNVLSGKYVWAFRLAALGFATFAVWVYFRRRGICTLDAARRQRNRILNVVLLSVLFGTAGYITLNYIVLAYLGAAAGLPWDIEHWAVPTAVALFVVGGGLYWVVTQYPRKSQ
jgi:RsiW-degrading membrane proteinase PrsW (M82 family)